MGLTPRSPEDFPQRTLELGAGDVGSPAVRDGVVYASSGLGADAAHVLFALSESNGAELWRFSTNGWIAGVLVSSALFGVVHLYQGASGMIASGLSGLVFACVYLATDRNLWASILAHGSMDTVGFLMIYFGVYPGL